jgi:1,4-alpha-glucan branching enzyme
MFAHPGKKLLFMGNDFGQWDEWNFRQSLDWHLLEQPMHRRLREYVKHLNRLHSQYNALHQIDFSHEGFEWVDSSDWEQNVICFLRKGRKSEDLLLVICNFTPMPRMDYRVGVPKDGIWKEILNSDAKEYGGSGVRNLGKIESEPIPFHGRDYSISLTLPPLGIIFLANEQKQ